MAKKTAPKVPNAGGSGVTEAKSKSKAPTKKKTAPKGVLSDLTAEESQQFEGRYFKKTNEAPHRDGVIVSTNGLDEDPKFIEVKYCIEKNWDEEVSKVEGDDLAFIEIL